MNLFELKNEEFILPSGKISIVKPMDGYIEDLLAEAVESKNVSTDLYDIILSHCTVSITGQENADRVSKSDIKNLYTGDRISLLLKIRQISLGNFLEVKIPCLSCKKENLWTIDIQKELFESESYITLDDLGGNERIIDIEGIEFKIILGTGKEEDNATKETSKLNNKCNSSIAKLARTKGYRRAGTNDKFTPLTVSLMQGLPYSVSQILKNELDKFRIGADITLDSNCGFCSSPIKSLIIQNGFFSLPTSSNN